MPKENTLSKILAFILKNESTFFLCLTFLSGIIALWPYHDFQFFLAQGDHGRELYCYKKTMEGALPYRECSWCFGPLMSYYYSTFYHIFGVSIQSVLLGQNTIILFMGTFIYLICSMFMPPRMSYVCSLWYWAFRGIEFFHAYDHIGGALLILITLYSLLRYIDQPSVAYIYTGFLSLFLLMLVRFNMGVAVLAGYFLCLVMTDFSKKTEHLFKKIKLYISLSLAIIIIALLIYWYLIKPLPSYTILQSFPYTSSHRSDNPINILESLALLWGIILSNFKGTLSKAALGIFTCLALSQYFYFSLKNLYLKVTTNTTLFFNSVFIFLIFGLHEFIISGVFFRAMWVNSLFFILIFYILYFPYFLHESTPDKTLTFKGIYTPFVKNIFILALFLAAFIQISDQNDMIRSYKNDQHLLHIGKNKVYTTQSPEWFETVQDASNYIIKNTPKNSKIFIIPHDSLYYFLTERDNAVRQLDFFKHNLIPKEQELDIISELENKNIQWIVVSNRIFTSEPGMGFFGITHCVLIANYINRHFEIVAQFGDWKNDAGWAWNHGVRILKRRETSKGPS